tara:strand:- start:781 stop:1068 length:288 start_codon:yes stop_codon:yes gene_type:complete
MMILMTALALMAQPAEAEAEIFDAATGVEQTSAVDQYLAFKGESGDGPAGTVDQTRTWTDPAPAAAQDSDIIMHGGGAGTASKPYQFDLDAPAPD